MNVLWRNGRIEEIRPGEAADTADWGVFTTAGCDHGRPLLWSRHHRRLLTSLVSLGAGDTLTLPSEDALSELLDAAGLDGPARLRVVARKAGPDRWNIEASAMSTGPVGPDQQPASLTVHRWDAVPPLVGHKTLARLPWDHARERAQHKGIDDALLVDSADHLLETSVANVWIVREGTVRTPHAPQHCLPGVMREWLIDNLGRVGLAAEVSDLTVLDLATAEEVWLSNAVIGVRRVCTVDHQQWQEWPNFDLLGDLEVAAPGW